MTYRELLDILNDRLTPDQLDRTITVQQNSEYFGVSEAYVMSDDDPDSDVIDPGTLVLVLP